MLLVQLFTIQFNRLRENCLFKTHLKGNSRTSPSINVFQFYIYLFFKLQFCISQTMVGYLVNLWTSSTLNKADSLFVANDISVLQLDGEKLNSYQLCTNVEPILVSGVWRWLLLSNVKDIKVLIILVIVVGFKSHSRSKWTPSRRKLSMKKEDSNFHYEYSSLDLKPKRIEWSSYFIWLQYPFAALIFKHYRTHVRQLESASNIFVEAYSHLYSRQIKPSRLRKKWVANPLTYTSEK